MRCRSSALRVFVGLLLNAYLLDALLSLHLLEAHWRLSLGVHAVQLQVLGLPTLIRGRECLLVLEHGRLVVSVALGRSKRKPQAVGVDGQSNVLTHLGTVFDSHLLTCSADTFVGRITVVVEVLALTAQVFSLPQLLDLLRGRSAASVDVRSIVRVASRSVLGGYCYVSRHDLRVNSSVAPTLFKIVSLLRSYLLRVLEALGPLLVVLE